MTTAMTAAAAAAAKRAAAILPPAAITSAVWQRAADEGDRCAHVSTPGGICDRVEAVDN